MCYPTNERDLLNRLQALFNDWKSEVGTDVFVEDGFYPHYFSQKMKVLFIGRESRGMTGRNYIEVLYDAYKNNNVGGQHINASFFHKRLLYVSYGLNNGMPNWEDIPNANEITNTFAVDNGFSFAFMNLSKLSNDSDDWVADWSLINESCNKSKNGKRNFFMEEVSLLSPDLIITMNLPESHLDLVFESLEELPSDGERLTAFKVNIGTISLSV